MSASATIPRQIIQTGKSRVLIGAAKAAAANLALLHPDWNFVFFDDDEVREFIAREFPEYESVFDAFPRNIQRYDFFRYLAVYRLGGFYFDLDVFLWQSLGSLLEHDSVFTFEELTVNRHLREQHRMDWELGNYAFGARADSPFLKAVIENCVRAQREPSWVAPMMQGIPRLFRTDLAVLNTTGPGLVTRTFAENPGLARDVKVLFPEDVCDPQQWHHFGTYGVHLMEGSWRDRGGFIRRRLACLWEDRLKRRLMPESIRLGKTRSAPAPNGAGASGVFSASSERFQPTVS